MPSNNRALRLLHISIVRFLYLLLLSTRANAQNKAIWTCCGVDKPAVWLRATCLLSATNLSINFISLGLDDICLYLLFISTLSSGERFNKRLLNTLFSFRKIAPSLQPVTPKYFDKEYTPIVLYGKWAIIDLKLSTNVQ